MTINPWKTKLISSLKVLFLLWLPACASTHPQELPDKKSPEAQLFLNVCSQCHSLPHPNQHTSAEWAETVKIMLRHMKSRGVSYNKDEIQTIINYLERNSS